MGCCAVLSWLVVQPILAADPAWKPVAFAQAAQPVPPVVPDQPKTPLPVELPAPRTLEGFGPSQIRLQRLPGQPGPLGTTPIPSEKERAEYGQFVQEFIDPRNVIDLVLNRTRVIILKEAPKRVQMGDERVATYNLLSPTELAVNGQHVNTTVLNLWFTDPKDPKKDKILSYLVRVIPDPEVKERLERTYKALQDEINNAFPDSLICLFLVGDKLVLTGQAKDVAEGAQILGIVSANAPGGGGGGGRGQSGGTPNGLPVGTMNPTAADPNDPNAPGGLPGLTNFLIASSSNVINLLRIPGEQQIMLRVMVAEVNRAAARSIGVNFNINNSNGVTVFGQSTGQILDSTLGGITGASTTTGSTSPSFGSITNNLPINLSNGKIPIALNALRTLNYARSLAEPNLVTMNGQTATFFAGGQFPVPVISGFTAAGLQGVSFIPFGVQLTFTPYMADKDRIRLNVQASVSTRNDNIGSGGFGGGGGGGGGQGGQGGGGGGAFVSGLNSRNFQTTVELREGQTLAVAGLIQTSLGADATRVPFFGDLPYIGRLFASDRTSHSEQELVILITPELVHPLEPKEMQPLPGADIFEPGDLEFYLLGRLEGRRMYDYRSSVRTDMARMAAYRHCEDVYILGPHGQTNAPPNPAVPLTPPSDGGQAPGPMPAAPPPQRFRRPIIGPQGGPYLTPTSNVNP